MKIKQLLESEGQFRSRASEEAVMSKETLMTMKDETVPDWEMLDHRILTAKYFAENHRQAVEFVDFINKISEYIDHFAEVTQDVAEVTVKTTTSDTNSLTILDFALAKAIDEYAKNNDIEQERIQGNFSESACPRTRASKCQCKSVSKITEAEDTVTAYCVLEHSDTVSGTILLKQTAGGPTFIAGRITGLKPGEHGFHIHQFGDMSRGCESMGPHYNPEGVDHGDLEQGHVGDLGNISADNSGAARIAIVAERIALTGEHSVVGRGIVVHSDRDDLGQGGDAESLKTGNAGDRLACGVILLKETVKEEAAGVGIVTKQNATADVPVGGEYQNVKKLFPKKRKKK